MIRYQPSTVMIDNRVLGSPMTQTVIKNLPDVPRRIISDPAELTPEMRFPGTSITVGKRTLFLTVHKGKFLKKCPGTAGEVCCNYYVLNPLSNCSFECSYCFLQTYLNNPFLVVYTNMEEMLEEVEAALAANPGRPFRMGTGEIADSLALDHITEMSRLLVPFFAAQKDALLELKTKSAQVENLLDLDPKGRVVISWSLNPQRIISQEEHKTASLEERLSAARRCQEAGYKIGFHLDPLIYSPRWEKEYKELLDQLFSVIDSRQILWVSLGGFRYPPELKEVMEERFPKTRLLYEEFVPGQDGKMGYLRQVRIQMYRTLHALIRSRNPRVFISLCMEGPDVWKDVFGWSPHCQVTANELFHEQGGRHEFF